MNLWLVRKFYDKNDNIYYEAHPYSIKGHIKCCILWYGFKGLKHCYLSKYKANRVAAKLTNEAKYE